MKKLLVLLSVVLFITTGSAQIHFSFSHFTSDNGLSQNSITSMFKDSKGFLWIGTRDGLNRFDGYNFRNFNSQFNKKFSGSSNRFLEIREDIFGFLWVKTYDEIVYRFDTDTEEFYRLKDENGNEITEKIRRFFILPCGDVWLATYKHGCFRVKYDDQSGLTTTKNYSLKSKNLPSDVIEKVALDKAANTWILTTNGLVCIDKEQKQSFKFLRQAFYSFNEDEKRILFGSIGSLIQFDKKAQTFKNINLKINSKIIDVQGVNSNFYILNAEKAGFLSFNVLKNEIQHYSLGQYPELKSNDIQQVYIDRAGDVWFGIVANGVVKFNVQTNKLEYLPTANTPERTTNPNILFAEDGKDVLWIQSYYGSFSWYDRKSNRLVPFNSLYSSDINTFLLYGVNHVLTDEQDILWISTNRGNGIFKCTFLPDYFGHYLLDNKSVYNVSNEVRAIFEDRLNRIWIATKDGLVHVYDENKSFIGNLDNSGRISKTGKTDILVYNFFQEKNGNIWLATRQKGLFRLKQGANALTYKMENFMHSDNNKYSPANNDFYSVTQDKTGRLWAGSYGAGLHLIQEDNGNVKFIHSLNDLKNYPVSNCSKVRHLFADSHNRLWIATTEGIVEFNANETNINKIKFIHYHNNRNSREGISANDIHYIIEDSNKDIWIASFGGGLSRLKNRDIHDNAFEFEKYESENGLPNNIIYTIVDDKIGNLWLTSENSIIKFNRKTKTIDVYGKGNEIENVEFSEAAACLLHSGEICVGSKSGFYAFNPSEVKRRVINAPIVLTGLKVLNKDVEITPGTFLPKQIDRMDKIQFTHKQNVFSIEFATLDMRAPEKVHYAYLLDGFDKDWNMVGAKQSATYTSLPPGDYVFRVKSTDSEGIWLNNERQIKIKILPSFWQSNLARILYVLFLIGIFVLALYIFTTIFKLKNNIHIEQQMADMKLRFFTDISHELRTPLTLISLPTDNILKENIDPFVRDQMMLIRKNLDKVMSLINQILDFRKLQNNRMQLNIEEINFGEFIAKSGWNFKEMAHAKSLNLYIENNTADATVWADPERLESIIQNLLTNAIKYTPSGKNIYVRTESAGDKLLLYVIDEGIGIPQEKMNFIFERFFSNTSLKSIVQKSTGIGLDLVKKMVELHHAEIQVQSQLGNGSTFCVSFKTGFEHFRNDMNHLIFNKKEIVEEIKNEDTGQKESLPPVEFEQHETNNPLILIVEDNDELRHYLSVSLKNNYRVAEATNGLRGWHKIETILPDIIIADLRMPEMDGMELTKKVREDNRTSHIPIILLTAVTDMESRMQGLKAGADDYITKPFNGEFLLTRIENLLVQRRKLQQFYRSQLVSSSNVVTAPPLENRKQDDSFMRKLLQVMNDNIENSELNIDMLASEFNMSRTVFFTKIKSLTGFSPVEFIREMRFERAAEYMRTTNMSISEISYQVGIDDPRYFSRCFKQKFGETPSDYKNKYQN